MIDNKELQEGLSRVREVATCQNWLRFEDVATGNEFSLSRKEAEVQFGKGLYFPSSVKYLGAFCTGFALKDRTVKFCSVVGGDLEVHTFDSLVERLGEDCDFDLASERIAYFSEFA